MCRLKAEVTICGRKGTQRAWGWDQYRGQVRKNIETYVKMSQQNPFLCILTKMVIKIKLETEKWLPAHSVLAEDLTLVPSTHFGSVGFVSSIRGLIEWCRKPSRYDNNMESESWPGKMKTSSTSLSWFLKDEPQRDGSETTLGLKTFQLIVLWNIFWVTNAKKKLVFLHGKNPQGIGISTAGNPFFGLHLPCKRHQIAHELTGSDLLSFPGGPLSRAGEDRGYDSLCFLGFRPEGLSLAMVTELALTGVGNKLLLDEAVASGGRAQCTRPRKALAALPSQVLCQEMLPHGL